MGRTLLVAGVVVASAEVLCAQAAPASGQRHADYAECLFASAFVL